MTNLKQKGYTFVELAIIIVVIGLITLLIMKGSQMLTQSRIKNVITDMDGVATAVEVYRGHYSAIPGDDARASRWPGVPVGNGSRVLEGPYNGDATQETSLFWWHLRRAGFLKGSADTIEGPVRPLNTVGGLIGVQDAAGAFGFYGMVICTDVPDQVAIGIDSRIDDGNPATGTVRAAPGQFGMPLPATGAAQYQEGNGTYMLCRTMLTAR